MEAIRAVYGGLTEVALHIALEVRLSAEDGLC